MSDYFAGGSEPPALFPNRKTVSDVLASIERASEKASRDLRVAHIMIEDEFQLRLEYQRKRDQWRRWACFWFAIAFVSVTALVTAIALWGWSLCTR